jgi:uracil-DNA glycosylase
MPRGSPAWLWPRDLDWHGFLSPLMQGDEMKRLEARVAQRRAAGPVFPGASDVFRALRCTPLASVRFVILGQDPYHNPGQAHGLSFSVPAGVPVPASLRNIFSELVQDTGCDRPLTGDLTPWTKSGGLLLNTLLTVDANQPFSHRGFGWEQFTDEVIRVVNRSANPVAFVLWGNAAQEKSSLIDESRHLVIRSAHPSPLSARRGFFGSRPFSRINAWRESLGLDPVDWSLAIGQ